MKQPTLFKIVGGILIIGLVLVLFLARNNHKILTQLSDNITLSTESVLQNPVTTDDYTVTEYSYGPTDKHTLDVYYKGDREVSAPIIVMVHGGGWQIGDKANAKVVEQKVSHYIPQGYMFISVNYPMIPDGAAVDRQAEALAEALIYIQANAASWGGDSSRLIVMGHSAGAHLISLVSATQILYPKLAPWSGTILLDSAAYDITATMEARGSDEFTAAFGKDRTYWTEMSPLTQLSSRTEPHFVVCSTKRAARVCNEAGRYVNKLHSFGTTATLYPVALNHEDINAELGRSSEYTDAVDIFITSNTQ